MASNDSGKRGDNQQDFFATLTVGLLVLVLTVFLLPLVGVAAGLYWLGFRKLSKAEATVTLVASIAISALWIESTVKQYLSWWPVVFSGRWAEVVTSLPWLSLALGGVTLACAYVLARDVGIVAGVAQRIGLAHKPTDLEKLTDFDDVVPDVYTRERIQLADPPSHLLRVDANDHSLEAEVPAGERSFPIAIDKTGCAVQLAERELRMHGLIFGSTGSGKTEVIKVIAGALLDLGWDGVVLDHKEDLSQGGLRDWCESYTAAHHRPYQQIYLSETSGSVWFNPIGGMSSDEARDTILAANTFPDAFWENINRNELGQVISMIYEAYTLDPEKVGEPNPMHIADVLRAGAGMRKSSRKYLAIIAAHKYGDLLEQEKRNKEHNREEEAKKSRTPNYNPKLRPTDLVAAKMQKDYPIVYNPSRDEASAAVGFASRLESIYFTQVGKNVLNFSPEKTMFNITAPGLTYVGLDSQGKPDLTRIISASVMRRMCVLASQRIRTHSAARQKFIIIDEANVVDRSSLMELLSRARQAGITVIAATQGPLDYNMNLDGTAFSGPGFAEIAQNVNVMVVMSQGTPEQAEILADYIGEEERALLPSQATVEGEVLNAGGVRVVRQHLVPASQLRDLRIGEAIVRVGKPQQWVKWSQFKMRSEIPDGDR